MILLVITFILYFSIVPYGIRLIYQKQEYFPNIYIFLKKNLYNRFPLKIGKCNNNIRI